jgi:protein gp37
MSKDTAIQWADSSLNLQMGCDGCELWNPAKGIFKCYAGNQTVRRGGGKGWPLRFEDPVLFLDRLDDALKWGDLTGKDRPGKPWLNGMPRIIFLNDMGDTFSAKLPLDWMAPLLPRMADSPHQWLVLTKRPTRFAALSELVEIPKNVWPGTTITSARTLNRVQQLAKVKGGGPKFLSIEPMWEEIDFLSEPTVAKTSWWIFGGESGEQPFRFELDWLTLGIQSAQMVGAMPFVKQFGANVTWHGETMKLKDSHGGDWSEWPEEFRIRRMPAITRQPALL